MTVGITLTHALAAAAAITVISLGSVVATAATDGACAGPCPPADYDGDRIKDWADNCPLNGNPSQRDSDKDTPAPPLDAGTPPSPVGEQTGPVRIYPATPYQTGFAAPTDPDPKTGGDACDSDDDNDGVYDRRLPGKGDRDNCRVAPNPDQRDTDGDDVGDACDDRLDVAPPVSIRISLPKRARYDDIRAGLPVTVRCSAGCRIAGELVIDRASARRIRLAAGARSLVVGRGTAALGASGTTYLFVTVPAKSIRSFRRALPRLRATLRIIALDGGARRPVWSGRVTLSR